MPRVKEKKERFLKEHLHLKAERCESPKCALVRRPYAPGAHGLSGRRGRKLSDFGRQSREKQKFKITYGVNERNLKRIFETASREKGSIDQKLLELLERRLDNALFKAGLAGSRTMGHQYIVHGHVVVNRKKVRSPSYAVKKLDLLGFRESSKIKARIFKDQKEFLKRYNPPAWISLDPEKLEAKILDFPENFEMPFEVSLLVQSFSK